MKRKLIIILAIGLFLRIILAFTVWHPDLNSNADWGVRFFQYGPHEFYAPQSNVWNFTWPNQPPGTIYMYAGVRKLFELVFSIFWFINVKVPAFPSGVVTLFESNLYPALLKLPAIVADIGIAVLIYKFIRNLKPRIRNYNEKMPLIGAVVFLVNPVIWYNSTIWGQTDAVISFLALLSLYLIFKDKIFLGIVALLLSFYIKISLVVFLPIFLIILVKKVKLGRLVGASLLGLGVIGLITLPFAQGEPFSWLLYIYQNKVLGQQLQIITANAFNFWVSIAGINEQPQTLPFLGLTYQYWGYILFGLAFVPVLYSVYKKQDLLTSIWALALTSFSSWMFLTNMHERYLYPFFPFATVLVAGNLIMLYPYILISVMSLLNLYNFWWVPRIEIIVHFLSFWERIVPRILGIVNLFLLVKLYVKGWFGSHVK